MVAVTSACTVQLAPAATLPPTYWMEPLPALAVSVPPVQVVEALGGVATVIPAGRLSTKAKLASATVDAVLSMVKVSVLTPPDTMLVGAKALLKPGCGITVRVSLAVPLLPVFEVRSPLVLTMAPEVDATTSTDRVQTLPEPTVPPL